METSKDRAKRIVDEENLVAKPIIKKKQQALQTERFENDMATQFPEAITKDEAEKLWFQDKTIA